MTRILTIILAIMPFLAFGQKTKDAYSDYFLGTSPPQLALPVQNNEALIKQELTKRKKGRPDHFATNVRVDVTPLNSGVWDYTNQDIAIWRYTLYSKAAKSINLGFTTYDMPADGKMYLYSKDKTDLKGPFTKADNSSYSQLWTPVIRGDELTIEVQIPISKINELQLQLNYVNHDFMDVLKSGSGSSGSCNIDVACGADNGFPIIDRHRDIINSVGAYTLNGIAQCSGVLINNARNDCTPYFLTAFHCEITSSNAASVVVYWNFENSTCRESGSIESGMDGDGSFEHFTTGSKYISGYAPSDFALIELNEQIDAEFDPFFAGWNITRDMPDSSMCIHHPAVEEKRISLDFDSAVINVDEAMDTYIRVESWDHGTTERGSSGAPLFNAQKEVIGQLNGGQADCINNSWDEFGPLFLSWEGGGTPETRLKDWLDPEGLDITAVAGKNCTFTLNLSQSVIDVCVTSGEQISTMVSVSETFDQQVNLSVKDLPNGLRLDFDQVSLAPGATTGISINNIDQLEPDVYVIGLEASDGTNQTETNLVLRVFTADADEIDIIRPANNQTDVLTNIIIEWDTESDEVEIEISNLENFSSTFLQQNIQREKRLIVQGLAPSTTYYWRMRSLNICGTGEWFSTQQFSTGQILCSDRYVQNEVALIPDDMSDTIRSSIVIGDVGNVENVSIPNITGLHTWVADLSFTLISPSGTRINLIDFICDDEDDFNFGFDDTIGEDDIPCPFADGRIYKPEEALSGFNGEPAQGKWILEIVDIATLDGGALQSWSLVLCVNQTNDYSLNIGQRNIESCKDSESLDISVGLGFEEPVSLKVSGPDIFGYSFTENDLKSGGSTELIISDLQMAGRGSYEIIVEASDIKNTTVDTLMITLTEGATSALLLLPEDEMTEVAIAPQIAWEKVENADEYILQISSSIEFDQLLIDTMISSSAVMLTENILDGETQYFWRVLAQGACGETVSDIQSFTTEKGSPTVEIGELKLKIYPNPARDNIYIDLSEALGQDMSVQVYSIDGKLVQESTTPKGNRNVSLDISDIGAGLYILRMSIADQSKTLRIFVE